MNLGLLEEQQEFLMTEPAPSPVSLLNFNPPTLAILCSDDNTEDVHNFCIDTYTHLKFSIHCFVTISCCRFSSLPCSTPAGSKISKSLSQLLAGAINCEPYTWINSVYYFSHKALLSLIYKDPFPRPPPPQTNDGFMYHDSNSIHKCSFAV